MNHDSPRFIVALLLAGYALVVALALTGTRLDLFAQDRPRLSGNCGPAAQGLTPDGDVVPIKVDRAGHVLPPAER